MNRLEFYSNLDQYKGKDNELKHYGIIGQKWGQRRWQYSDGRFNEEGKIRYFGKGNNKSSNTKIGSDYYMFSDSDSWTTRKYKKDISELVKRYNKTDNSEYERYLSENVKEKDRDLIDAYVKKFVRQEDRGGNELNNAHFNNISTNAFSGKFGSQEGQSEEPKIDKTSPEYKEKYKSLKKEAKAKGIPFGFRGDTARWCLEHGIEEINERVVDGYKAGDEFTNYEIDKAFADNIFKRLVVSEKQKDFMKNEKRTKEFKENNESYKQFRKEYEKVEKDLDDCAKELDKMVRKEMEFDDNIKITLKLNTNNGINVVAINKETGYPVAYTVANQGDFNKICQNYLLTSKLVNQEFKDKLKNTRTALSKAEDECRNFAKDYLAYWGDRECFDRNLMKVNMETGKVDRLKNYEYYGYKMTEEDWYKVGGP